VDHAGGRKRAAVREELYGVLRRARDLRDLSVAAALDRIDAITPADVPLSPTRAESVARHWLAANGADPATRAELWRQLDDLVAWLQRANGVLATQEGQDEWRESPWSRMKPPGVALPACDLPLIFGGSGMPTASSLVRFHVIGSDTQPADVAGYRTLLDAQLLDGYKAALAKPVQDLLDADTLRRLLVDRTLFSSSKLAGLRIANFAGFLSTDWRRNDWWWGRLDASAGILSFLESMEPAPHMEVVAESEIGGVHEALLHEMNGSRDRPYGRKAPEDPSQIRAQMVRGTQDLESLRSGYRIALASRVVRTASAALVRDTPRLSPMRISQWLLRPVLVLAPLLLSTPRLILGLIIIACGLMLSVRELTGALDESAGLSRSLAGAIIACALAAGFVIARFVTAANAARLRRSRIGAHLEDDADNQLADAARVRGIVRTAERRARAPRITLVVIAAALLAVFFVVSWRFGLWTLPFWVSLITLVSVTELTHRQLQTVAVARRRRPGRWAALVLFAAAAILVTNLLPPLLDGLTADMAPPMREIVWRWIAAAVVVAAMTITLFATTMRARHLLVVLVLAEITMLVAVAATTWLGSLDDGVTGGDPVAVAIAAGIATAQGWAAYLITAWAIGTVLWWAPWFRGFELKAKPPTDAVWDLQPGSIIGEQPQR